MPFFLGPTAKDSLIFIYVFNRKMIVWWRWRHWDILFRLLVQNQGFAVDKVAEGRVTFRELYTHFKIKSTTIIGTCVRLVLTMNKYDLSKNSGNPDFRRKMKLLTFLIAFPVSSYYESLKLNYNSTQLLKLLKLSHLIVLINFT